MAEVGQERPSHLTIFTGDDFRDSARGLNLAMVESSAFIFTEHI